MAFFSIGGVSIRGLAAAVPSHKESNYELDGMQPDEIAKLVATIGIESRHVARDHQCASDLCVASAEKLIAELGWKKDELEVLFFVSQTPDYSVPGSSMYIQHKLGLPKSCITFDINQGCAGYVYGLSLISAFLSSSGLSKGLLLVGDTITRLISPSDRSLRPLFADCGTATALVRDVHATAMHFNTTTEAEGFEAIMVPAGGARKPIRHDSLELIDHGSNVKRSEAHLAMKGLEVFNFSLTKVVPNVQDLLNRAGYTVKDPDYFVFHQANGLILQSLGKKLGVESARLPSSLRHYGNTSGASIPLTIVSELAKNGRVAEGKMLLAGFGVGLSLGSVIVDFNNVTAPQILEI